MHEKSNDLVITSALGYPPDMLKRFFQSLRSVFLGKIVVVIYEDQIETYRAHLTRYDLQYFPAKRGSQQAPHTDRYFYYREILVREKAVHRCFLTDSRDVIFQTSPFREETAHLYLYAEPISIAECSFNSSWISRYYGLEGLRNIGKNPVLCSGTTLGTRKEIAAYVGIMCDEIDRVKKLDSPAAQIRDRLHDQALHNFLYYTGRFQNAKVREYGFSEVQTLHHAKSLTFDRQCFLLNRDMTRVPVVHQYDRFPEYFPVFDHMLKNIRRLIPIEALYSNLLREFLTTGKRQIVQIGANDGKINDPIYRFVMACKENTRIALVEPQANIIAYLEENYREHPDATVLNLAIGSGKSLKMYRLKPELYDVFIKKYMQDSPNYRVPSGFTSSSKNHVMNHVRGNLPAGISMQDAIEEFEVPAVDLEGALSSLSWAEKRVDLLQIDAEGHDDEVLYSCNLEKLRPRIIHYEHTHLGREKSQALTEKLTSLGYHVYRYSRTETLATSFKLNHAKIQATLELNSG